MSRKSIEDMIMSGASWEDIKKRIDEIQEEKAKKDAEAEAKAKTKALCEARRATFISAFIDWLIAEKVITEKDRTELAALMNRESSRLLSEARSLMRIFPLL